jgi:hypothetical protein
MAKSLSTESGTLYIPGAYSKYTVKSNPSGLAVSGVLILIGEAEGGPDFTSELDLELNAFGPDQSAEVQAKYLAGPLVDAFNGAVAAANDPDITGSLSRVILVKTNSSLKAAANLSKIGGGTYAVLADKSYGKAGNLIQYQVTSAQAEVVPTTSAFTFIPAVGTVSYVIRVNGDAAVTGGLLGANTQPDAFVTAINALAGVDATGGANRNILAVSGTLILDQNPSSAPGARNVKVTRSVAWAVTPVIGDSLIIPTGSVIAGGADQNVGAYVVIAADSTTVTATKLSDAGNGAAVIGTITTPVDFGAFSISAVTDVMSFSPVTIKLTAANVIDGRGKSLEIAETTSGTDLLSRTAFNLGTTVAVSWVSKASAPKLLASAAEYKVKLALSRSSPSASESYTVGGEMPLRLGYTGTTATVTITDTTLSTSITGGSGADLSLTLADYPTLQTLADFINTQTGYSASLETAALGNLSPVLLDNVSAEKMCSQFGSLGPARLKIDAWRLSDALASASGLAQIGNPAAQADAGLPDVSGPGFLAGGARGATLEASITAALLALESVRGNFIIPLFSRDASLDIADGDTDAASTYAIDAINSAVKSHVLSMSTFKRRRNRQAVLSYEGAFADQKNAAANTAAFRCNMAFQDSKTNDSAGNLVQFQPWMLAAKAAGMQAAGFYKSIEFKGINVSGVLHRAGDFNAKNDSNVEDALKAGLMPARVPESGSGFVWVSDQTTYGNDSNFVFNSMQAVYDADLVSLTTSQRMEKAFVGKSLADISAAMAATTLDAIMADMMRIKLIAPSDDAKKGYKDAKIRISGNAMLVSLSIRLSGTIDFIVIDFLISQVEQAA